MPKVEKYTEKKKKEEGGGKNTNEQNDKQGYMPYKDDIWRCTVFLRK